jgi:hypothetical protein
MGGGAWHARTPSTATAWQTASDNTDEATASEVVMSKRSASDEHYLLDICDRVLPERAIRQHRFPFLLGDPGKGGRQSRLPVDGYYEDLKLVVEVMEGQHVEGTVAFFDRRLTVSGVSRGQQRALYDQRRREVLPKQGLQLVCLAINEFDMRDRRRLRRDPAADEKVIRRKLSAYLPQSAR